MIRFVLGGIGWGLLILLMAKYEHWSGGGKPKDSRLTKLFRALLMEKPERSEERLAYASALRIEAYVILMAFLVLAIVPIEMEMRHRVGSILFVASFVMMVALGFYAEFKHKGRSRNGA